MPISGRSISEHIVSPISEQVMSSISEHVQTHVKTYKHTLQNPSPIKYRPTNLE